MKATFTLPEDYQAKYIINLKEKRPAILVNGLALVITLILILFGAMYCPFSKLLDPLDLTAALRLLSVGIGCLVYIPLHELVHGLFIRIYSGRRAKYGFTLMYAYAGSDAWFAKGPYIVIALAPVVLWGIVLAAIQSLVPLSWFWVVYFIQIVNLSGAAGDLYVFVRLLREKPDILIRDTGTDMTVWGK